MRNKLAIGVDLGGTNITAGQVTAKGKIFKVKTAPTLARERKEKVISRIKGLIHLLMTDQVIGIGIGSPGPLSSSRGIVYNPPNLPGWKNVPLRAILAREFKLPVILENDANAACFGEKWVGRGKGVKSLICLTLGTGIGGGIILENKLIRGIDDTAAEIGHMTIDPDGPKCGCGNYGCLESFSSATALVKRAREILSQNKKSILHQLPEDKPLTAKDIYEAAKKGDSLARELLEETGRYLGIGIATLINLLNPEMVVLSGRMAGAKEFIFGAIHEEIKKRSFAVPFRRVKIRTSSLGEYAGIIGAAGLVWTETKLFRYDY